MQQTTTMTLDQALQQAIMHHRAGHLPSARELYCAILKVAPQHQDANHNLGVLLLQTQQSVAALPYFKQALVVNPGQGQFWVSYIDALIQAGKAEEAAKVLRQGRQVGLRGAAVDALAQRLAGKGPSQGEPGAAEAAGNTIVAHTLALAGPEAIALEKKNHLQTSTPVVPRKETQSQSEAAPGERELAALIDLVNRGRFSEAETQARALTMQFPQHAFAWKVLGVVLRRLGRGGEALEPMLEAARLLPGEADVQYNLGNIFREQGRLLDAEASYRRAVDLSPDLTAAHYNLANMLQALGRFREAEASYHRVLKIKPDHAEAHCNLGNTLQDLGRLSEAEICYRRALEIKPDFAGALSNLGLILQDQGRLREAEACHRRAMEIKPDYAGAYNNLGLTLREQGRLPEAEACYRRLLEMKPEHADGHNNLGGVLKDQGRLMEAEASYRKTLRINPEHADAHNNLGIVLKEQGRPEEAENSYRRALGIRPDYADAHSNLGNTLKEQGRLLEAEISYRQALTINPAHAEAYNNLGNILKDLGKPSEAEACFRQALVINPGYLDAYSNLLGVLNHTNSHSPEFCRAEAEGYGRLVAAKVASSDAPFTSWTCPLQPKRLRVGLVSGDLRAHPVGYFLEGVLSHIEPGLVELLAYSTYHKEDGLTRRIRQHFAAWKSLQGLNDEAAARLIRSDCVHILIDLAGHTAHNRLPVFAWKPAPVQVSWLGYFATTGVATMDYLLADEIGVPQDRRGAFVEDIWYLPETRLCFSPPDGSFPVAPLPALQSVAFTFGSFQSLAKVGDDVLAVWGRIFSMLPQARLRWQCKSFNDAGLVAQTLERLRRHGVPSERVALHGAVAREMYLQAYAEVDVILDSFPYPGGTTTCEALWMGVPTLTLAGDRMHSRQGASLLAAAGLGNSWVAETTEDYVRLARDITRNIAALSRLRVGLREQVRHSPVFRAEQFARNLEVAFWGMWQEKGRIQESE